MAGNLECTCPRETIGHPDSPVHRTEVTGTTPGCPTHDPNGRPELGLVDMLEVLALTQIALDPDAPKSRRMAARHKAAKALGLNEDMRFLP